MATIDWWPIGRIQDPETRQAYDVIRSGDHFVVLLPLNTDSCAPSAHKLDEVRADLRTGRVGASWWRSSVVALVDRDVEQRASGAKPS